MAFPVTSGMRLVPYVRKCILCYERIQATVNSPRAPRYARLRRRSSATGTTLLAEAHRRITEKPDLYLNKVWGETEAHGSSVLYVSNVDLSFLTDGHAIPSDPLPEKTAAAMGAVPYTFCGGQMYGVPLLHDGLPRMAFPATSGMQPFPTCANASSVTTEFERVSSPPARKHVPLRRRFSAIVTPCSSRPIGASPSSRCVHRSRVG